MITTLYLILFLISVAYLFILLNRFGTKVSAYYILLSVCTILVNFGYWQVSVSGTVEEALVASRVSYLGASYISFLMVCCIAKLTKTKLPVAILIIGICLSTTVAALAMTIGYNDLYYKSAELCRVDGFSYLVKEYAPSHWLFTLQIVLSMGYGFYLIAVAFSKQKRVSYISSICSLAVMASVVLVYFIKTGIYSLLPLAYDIGFAIILFLLNRIYLYDTENISLEDMKDSREYGFVNFDSRRRFIDGDAVARAWFPELNELKIDHCVADCNTDFLRQVNDWVTEKDVDSTHYFRCKDKIIEAKSSALTLRTKKKVFCIRLHDDTKQQEYTRLIENYNRDLKENIALKTKRIEQMLNDITIGMASIVEDRDANTGGHIRRTSDIVSIFVKSLIRDGKVTELNEETADCIIRSAPLHDFGKIAIPDVILNKPGKYTPQEYDVMKKHTVYGADIVERILQSSEDTSFKTIAQNIAHYHHEKWDGSGYPQGLKGEEIPLEARIMALADVFDALVSKRVYKEKYSFDKAFSIIKESSGSHFDPFLCESFLSCRDELISVCSANSDD